MLLLAIGWIVCIIISNIAVRKDFGYVPPILFVLNIVGGPFATISILMSFAPEIKLFKKEK